MIAPLEPIQVREHGGSGPTVVVLHGGPGAPGSAAPLARALADDFRVLEPYQRRSGAVPLTVARHVDDLHSVILARCPESPPALVGHSWGAMLALAYAAEHSADAGPLALVGCGTFDTASRAVLEATRRRRLGEDAFRRLEALADGSGDHPERIPQIHDTLQRADAYDPFPSESEGHSPPFDPVGHRETWQDMLRLQADGVYPAAFSAIRSPVAMFHGAHDPHPGPMIGDCLRALIPQLEYYELPRCGHEPWLERHARDEFFARLRSWLSEHLRDA